MSLFWTDRVWNHSRQTGSNLFVLVAIADFVNESGETFAKIETIAKKVRLSPRQVQRIIAALERSGELIVERCPGRSQDQVFKIGNALCTVENKPAQKGDISGVKGDIGVTFSPSEKVTSEVVKGDISGVKGDISGNPLKLPYKDNSINPDERSREREPEQPRGSPPARSENHSHSQPITPGRVLSFTPSRLLVDEPFLLEMQVRFPDLDVPFVAEKMKLAGGAQTKARLLSWLGNERPKSNFPEVKNDERNPNRNPNRNGNRAGHGEQVEPESARDSRAEIERLGFRPAKVI